MTKNNKMLRTVEKALDILWKIGHSNLTRGITLSELSQELSIHPSTVHRYLYTLERLGYIERQRDTDRFRLGLKLLELTTLLLDQLELRAEAYVTLHELMEITNETIHLMVYDHGTVVYIDKVDAPQAVRMHSRIGMRRPAYTTSGGKAMLAYLGEDCLNEVLGRGLVPRTVHTITSPEVLRRQLREIRSRGFAIDDMEDTDGVRCVGAPIFDHRGFVIGAVTVSGPASRISLERADELGPVVVAAAQKISARMGYRPARWPYSAV